MSLKNLLGITLWHFSLNEETSAFLFTMSKSFRVLKTLVQKSVMALASSHLSGILNYQMLRTGRELIHTTKYITIRHLFVAMFADRVHIISTCDLTVKSHVLYPLKKKLIFISFLHLICHKQQ